MITTLKSSMTWYILPVCKIKFQWVEKRSATEGRVKYYLLDETVQASYGKREAARHRQTPTMNR